MVIWQETRSISTVKNIKSAAQATCHVIKNDQCKGKSNSLTARSVALKKKKLKEKAENDVSAPRRTLAEIRTFCAARWHIFFPIIIIINIIIIMIIIILLLLFYLRDRLRQEGGTAYILD